MGKDFNKTTKYNFTNSLYEGMAVLAKLAENWQTAKLKYHQICYNFDTSILEKYEVADWVFGGGLNVTNVLFAK